MNRRDLMALALMTSLRARSAKAADRPPVKPTTGSPPPMLRAASAPWLPGVNIAGGEFNGRRTVRGKDYIYPTASELAYFVAKGMRIFRVPFLAQRLVAPRPGGMPEPTTDVRILAKLIDAAARLDAYVILDMHSYGSAGNGGIIGRDPGAAEDFARTWGLLADALKDRPNLVYGLMNEPHKQSAVEWLAGANGAIAAIRAAGGQQLILVPGVNWSGAHSWVKGDNARVMPGIVDPADNFAYEVHQYLDADNSGQHAEIVAGKGAVVLKPFTEWARERGVRAFLGEFAWAADPAAMVEGRDLLAFMAANRDVWIGWTYWAAGAWWGDYMFSVAPRAGVDKPQMTLLEQYAR